MTQQQIHNKINRARRIPRRIRQLKAEANSFDARVAEIEDQPLSKELTQEVKEAQIKKIRDRAKPVHAQIIRLSDRYLDLRGEL